MAKTPTTLDILRDLIAFDTVSHHSNLRMIDYIRDYMTALGVAVRLTHDDEGQKANLYATLGPDDRGGIVLSGHTDVVPVDGQNWKNDPFVATLKEDKVYGRGTSDMKTFIAACLAMAPRFLARQPKTPLHFAFSYDEEVGCIGVRRLLADLEQLEVKPLACIVGEPTEMRVVTAHKGKKSFSCDVHGHPVHSALTPKGVNAIEFAAEMISFITRLGHRLRDQGPFDHAFDPPYTTIQTGTIHGGTALNIVPQNCRFDVELRPLPTDDADALFREIKDYAEKELLPRMQGVHGEAGFSWDEKRAFPGLKTGDDADITILAKTISGANTTGTVSFGTEAGLFHDQGIPAIICGPGSVEQAHQANEFITREQIDRCDAFLGRLVDRLCP